MKDRLKGLYMVVDPKEGFDLLRDKIEQALGGGVSIIQVWDHWADGQDRVAFIKKLLCISGDVPVLVNNDFALAELPGVSGIHLDRIEDVNKLGTKELIVGVTLSGATDWQALQPLGIDYISFCSVFPSSSTDACELVDFETVREACTQFPGSVFASGGINLDNANQIMELGVSGVALISGLLKADDTYMAAQNFNKLIEK